MYIFIVYIHTYACLLAYVFSDSCNKRKYTYAHSSKQQKLWQIYTEDILMQACIHTYICTYTCLLASESCVYAHMHARTHICMYMHIHMYTYIRRNEYTHIFICIQKHICINGYMHVCIFINVQAMCMQKNIHTNVRIHIYTHIQTSASLRVLRNTCIYT